MIRSKYRATCPTCQKTIQVGEQIHRPAKVWIHIWCGNEEKKKPISRKVQRVVIRRFKIY